jgi:L-lysine 2,3-aminomutase
LPLQRVVVLHANHPNELDASVEAACARLREAGATLLNQSVLLRGVNDDAAALAGLSERLFACGVLPYYLHQLDRVRGTAHFEVPDARARGLVDGLRARLPGYLVPRLVRELPGESAKTPI